MAPTRWSFGPDWWSAAARLRRPDRLLVAHPLRPVELIPVVEIVPGPLTSPTCVEDVRFWLRRLGRAPIVLLKEIKGNIIGRISAAVWRECIGLVLEGAISVEDLDRAVSMGPAVAWSAAGPHLDHYLSARGRAPSMYLNRILGEYEELWESLATWTKLEIDEQHKLIRAIERGYEEESNALLAARDSRLVALLNAMKRS